MINRSAQISQAVGSRIHVVRLARMEGDQPEIVARLFECSVEKWLSFESGQRAMDSFELITFCFRFRVSPEFILLGNEERLDETLKQRIEVETSESAPDKPVFWRFRLRELSGTLAPNRTCQTIA
jgi:hypothetical protein